MTQDFITFLSENLKIPAGRFEDIFSNCPVKKLKKNDFLLKEGQICKQTFFVEKGLLKQYTIDAKGKEHILYFAPEKWFISDRTSLLFNKPSAYFIQALEDTQVQVLDEEFTIRLSHRVPEFVEFNNKLVQTHIAQLQKRVSSLLGASAEERYIQFTNIYPDIMMRVPQALIASYLGITPESLSRVRKELIFK